jgi:hypothetical protein
MAEIAELGSLESKEWEFVRARGCWMRCRRRVSAFFVLFFRLDGSPPVYTHGLLFGTCGKATSC